jgi:predicted alpha/beta hydrolase family esterase
VSHGASTVLVVPGYGNSGPAHWQSLWQAKHPEYRRVNQKDWENPERADWVDALDAAVRVAGGPVMFVAHSLGCLTVAHWAAAHRGPVTGALLVAPADVEAMELPPSILTFRPIPRGRLPFPSIVAASDDDLFADLERARGWARDWGSRFVRLERAGHINADAGFGPWPEGEALLDELSA